jgi:hypothetical protein
MPTRQVGQSLDAISRNVIQQALQGGANRLQAQQLARRVSQRLGQQTPAQPGGLAAAQANFGHGAGAIRPFGGLDPTPYLSMQRSPDYMYRHAREQLLRQGMPLPEANRQAGQLMDHVVRHGSQPSMARLRWAQQMEGRGV